MKLKLYTDRSFLPGGKKYTSLLFPFWGNPERDKEDMDFGRFDEYTEKGRDIFEIVDEPGAADVFVLPYEFSFEESDMIFSARMDELAEKYDRKVLVFFNSDSYQEIPMKHAIVFRTSFFKSARKKNEFAFPGWSIDFVKVKKGNAPDQKPGRPSVSYCGYVDYLNFAETFTLDNIIRNVRGRANSADKIGPALRGRAVRALLNDGRIQSNFIIRKGFWAPGLDKKKARMEYIDNIFQSDYALVARGAGNFSYRLYEVLSSGKIPVFINTDSVLPFDQLIDWKKYLVWVEEKEIGEIGNILLAFHEKLSDQDFIEAGRNCRKLYDEWVSPLGFYRNIYKCLN